MDALPLLHALALPMVRWDGSKTWELLVCIRDSFLRRVVAQRVSCCCMLLLDGPIPAGAHPGIATYLGIYKRRPQDVNGRPSYVMQDDFVDGDGEAKAIWFAKDARRGKEGWFVGLARNIGSSKSALAVNSRAKRPEDVQDPWECSRGGPRPWVAAPDLKACEHPEWLRQGIDRVHARCVSPLRDAMRDVMIHTG